MIPILGLMVPLVEENILPMVVGRLSRASDFDLKPDNLASFRSKIHKAVVHLLLAKMEVSLPDYQVSISEEWYPEGKVCYLNFLKGGKNYFSHRLPFYSLSLSFVEKGRIIGSLITDVGHYNIYFCHIGHGVFVSRQDGQFRLRAKNSDRDLLVHANQNLLPHFWESKKGSVISFLNDSLAICYLLENHFDGVLVGNRHDKINIETLAGLQMAQLTGYLSFNMKGEEMSLTDELFAPIILCHPQKIKKIIQILKVSSDQKLN